MLNYEQGQVSLETGFEPIDKAIDIINKYITEGVTYQYYESKNNRLRCWFPTNEEVYELVISIFTVALLEEKTTLQSMIGMCAGKIGLNDPLDQAKTVAECIALCAQADLIDIDAGSTYMVSTPWELDKEIDRSDKHILLTRKPEPKTENQLLGCKYKQHTGDTSLDVINKQNSIAFALNIPLLMQMEEEATFEIDTVQKKEQWDLFKSKSIKKYLETVNRSNEFYLEHSEDVRGRLYCEGYYISYQGSSFKKSIVHLAHKEMVKL